MATIPPRSTEQASDEDMEVELAICQLLRVHWFNKHLPKGTVPSGSDGPFMSKVWIFGPLSASDPRVGAQLEAACKSLENKNIEPFQHLTCQPEGQEKTIVLAHSPSKEDTRVFLNGHQIHSVFEWVYRDPCVMIPATSYVP